jgi:diguanylate cyclase (GGDEF)-like protein
MTDLFDIRTLFFIGALTSLLSAVTLLVMRRLHRRSEAALRWGAGGLALSGLAMMCVALRGLIPDSASWVGANTLGPAGMFVLYEAVRRLCHARPHPWLAAGATLLVFAWQAWLGASPDLQAQRLVGSASTQAVAAAMMVPLLLRRIGRDPAGPVAAAIALALTFAVAHGARALWILLHGVSMSADGQHAAGPLQAGVAALFVLGPMVQAMVVLAWIYGRVADGLRAMARTDELTGLASRRSFFARARRLLDERRQDADPCALLMIDLDDFKRINDRHGHRVGDRALAHFAGTLRRSMRQGDLCGRYGGEEFCALVERGGEQELLQLAEAVRRAVAESAFEHEGERVPLTVSIGVATTAEHPEFEALLATADRRVYLAKSMGRDRVVASDPPPGFDRRQGAGRRRSDGDAELQEDGTGFDTTIARRPAQREAGTSPRRATDTEEAATR